MGVDFTVYKGSSSGDIVAVKGHRDLKPTQVSVKISHCGVCGTDEHYRHADVGLGHEGVGIITELGSMVSEVSDLKVGDRVGLSYHQKFCGHCKYCQQGRQNLCPDAELFGSSNTDQGCYSTGVAWDVSNIHKLPEGLESEFAGPLMCGGATVWDPLYSSGAKPGDRVGIIGVGGLGHLAIQFASKMGLEPVVFSSTDSKKEQALAFGAAEFHATKNNDKLNQIEKLELLIITANTGVKLSSYMPLLAPGAKVYPLTVSQEELGISPLDLIGTAAHIIGSGVAPPDSIRAMLDFAAKHDVKPQIEKFPMSTEGVTEAMQKLRDGKMRYRGVLVV
ncbi:hypothetical protein NLU13_3485 [Sarocladium strictum]|uniref:Enoyl reductase (ER) domain-containing protein n=1 Tax=Sarocladium strictum TaxID=5046 RepID=A0AA39LAA7_SARSR|nr:hypothetical protein NLU13_3485 [Sarocladium strictum]